MLVSFKTSKLKKTFEKEQLLRKEYGDKCARKIMIRLAVLRAANNLSLVPKVRPDRCHELKGQRKGQFAVDLVHPFRLVFAPEGDGSNDLAQVTSIKILKVEDYHK